MKSEKYLHHDVEIVKANGKREKVLSLEEANRMVKRIIDKYIPEPDYCRYGGLNEHEFDWAVSDEICFGVHCNLYVRNEWLENDFIKMESLRELNPDYEVRPFNLKIELNWSATTRSLSRATTAINLYTKYRDCGAEIESVFAGEEFISYKLPTLGDLTETDELIEDESNFS